MKYKNGLAGGGCGCESPPEEEGLSGGNEELKACNKQRDELKDQMGWFSEALDSQAADFRKQFKKEQSRLLEERQNVESNLRQTEKEMAKRTKDLEACVKKRDNLKEYVDWYEGALEMESNRAAGFREQLREANAKVNQKTVAAKCPDLSLRWKEKQGYKLHGGEESSRWHTFGLLLLAVLLGLCMYRHRNQHRLITNLARNPGNNYGMARQVALVQPRAPPPYSAT